MTDLADLSLVEAADAVRDGDATSMELLDACWRNLEAVNPKLNATIWLDREGSKQAAEEADRAVREGSWLGPLHGVPLAHKDMYYQAGRLSTCGSAIRRNYRPGVTATVIEKLHAAGAYTFGGLNMAEFAQNPTGHNRAFGDCHNPWNLPYITGGSSSGSGVSVAARFNYAALGSDTGGSIRLPASACGVTGIKPTQTRVSRFGVMPLSFSADNVGPLTRTARDCARIMGLIAGRDPRDPTSSHEPVPDYEAALDGDIRGLNIGVPVTWFLDEVDSPVLDALEHALAVLTARGAVVHRITLPLMDAVTTYGGIISRVEAATIHAQWMRERAGDYGIHISGADVRRLCNPGDLLCGGAEPARADLESICQRGICQGRCSGHADHTHMPADAGGDRYRSRAAGHGDKVHGRLGEHAAVQLPRAAGRQRELWL